jgi:hypothetical protein
MDQCKTDSFTHQTHMPCPILCMARLVSFFDIQVMLFAYLDEHSPYHANLVVFVCI